MKTERMRAVILAMTAAAVVSLAVVPAFADPCLVVYPTGSCIYHYDVDIYYTVTMGDPLYDPMYDRGGEVLLRWDTNEVDLSVYQAPGLVGFTPSTGGNEGYFFVGNSLDLVVDGFNRTPTTYVNILLVFEPDPSECTPMITVDGNPAMYDAGLGWYYPIGDLVVSTPTPEGNNYSDTMTFTVHFELCSGITIWAFADEDHDLMWTDSECFTAFSHDTTVPVQDKTWGGIKVIFGEQ